MEYTDILYYNSKIGDKVLKFSNGIKKILALILLCGGVLLSLCAQSTGRNNLSLSSALTFQKIYYKNSEYENRFTIGPGLNAKYEYLTKHNSYLGLSLSYEVFRYNDFYGYNDLKLAAGIRRQLLSFGSGADANIDLYYLAGTGFDFVFRNDGDSERYPYFVAGLLLETQVYKEIDFIFKVTAGITLQRGSVVLHTGTQMGILLRLDELKGESR